MAMQVIDYLDTYTALCQQKGTFIIRSIQSALESAVEGGPVPDSFLINGNSSDLRYTRVTDDYLDILLKPMGAVTFLRRLDLSFNEIGDRGACALATFLTKDRCLHVVNLASNNVGPEGGSALAKALNMNDVIYDFNISGNHIGKDGGMDFANMLQVNVTIKYLGLGNTAQSTQTLMAFATVLTNNNTLLKLDISNNAMHFASLTQSLQTDVMVHWSKTLRYNKTLTELNFGKMAVSDWDMVNTLASAVHDNRGVQKLDLSCNKFTRDGGTSLCRALHYHPILTTVNLSCCALQDEGAEAVRALLEHNDVLENLFLDHNRMTGAGLISVGYGIANNKSIKTLRVWGNKWTVPACEVFSVLVGGPVRSVRIGSTDDRPQAPKSNARARALARASVSAPTTPKPDDAPPDSVVVGTPNSENKPSPEAEEVSHAKGRLGRDAIDVVFYLVEGVCCVARQDMDHKK